MSTEKKPKETWLTAFGDSWIARFGGQPKYGILAKELRPIIAQYGEARTLAAWKTWLVQQSAAYVNVSRFASTIGVWMGEHTEAGDKSQQELNMIDQWASESDAAR